MIVSRLCHDCVMIVSRLCHNCVTIVSRLWHNFDTIMWRLCQHCLRVVSGLCQDCVTFVSRLCHECVEIFPSSSSKPFGYYCLNLSHSMCLSLDARLPEGVLIAFDVIFSSLSYFHFLFPFFITSSLFVCPPLGEYYACCCCYRWTFSALSFFLLFMSVCVYPSF